MTPRLCVAQVHVMGGYNDEDGLLNSAERFDGERWTEVPGFDTMRTGHGAFVLAGHGAFVLAAPTGGTTTAPAGRQQRRCDSAGGTTTAPV